MTPLPDFRPNLRIPRQPCRNCVTQIPVSKKSGLCHFCERTEAAEIPMRECLRCRRAKPVDLFAGRVRKFRICDDCRWQGPMSDEEKRRAHGMAPYYDLRRRRRREAHLRRAA